MDVSTFPSTARTARPESAERLSVAIVDYQAGNLRSLTAAFTALGARVILLDRPRSDLRFDRLVVPGVGAFDWACRRLNSTGLKELIQQAIADGVPVLGVCLGLQWLWETSEEGHERGLGHWPGRVVRFRNVPRVPHMGWNRVQWVVGARRPSWLAGFPSGYAYFAHSYYPEPADPDLVWAITEYGPVRFPSVVGRGSVVGVQFHPEKSGTWGLAFLRRWLEGEGTGRRTEESD
jgi:glutamine amidotransferase